MIYIEKTHSPQLLVDFIETEKKVIDIDANFDEVGRQNRYVAFGGLNTVQKNDLRLHLYNEQRGLCCYCMRVLEKETLSANTTIEHFLPESAFIENQVDYFNLYLACKISHGNRNKDETCDLYKKHHLIPKFIGYFNRNNNEKCQDFFQYNSNGEILPKGSRKIYEKVCENYKSLSLPEKSALITIDTLNLNVNPLKTERKIFIEMLEKQLEKVDRETLEKS